MKLRFSWLKWVWLVIMIAVVANDFHRYGVHNFNPWISVAIVAFIGPFIFRSKASYDVAATSGGAADAPTMDELAPPPDWAIQGYEPIETPVEE